MPIIVLTLLSSNVFAEEYKLTIDKMNYKNAIQLACNDDLILNSENKCVSQIPTCEAPLVLNESQDACIDPILSVDWIYTTGDNCNGMRQSNFNPKVYFARSKTSSYNLSFTIPIGYHWVTKSEYTSLFNGSSVNTKNNLIHPYHAQCGLSGYPVSVTGQNQHVMLFSGGGTGGMHTGNYEYHGVTSTTHSGVSNFAGYVLYKD
jgi:hypothetical protein